MIHVIATIQVAPGTRAAFLEQFRAVMPHVLAEEGCIEYGPAVDVHTTLAIQEPVRDDVVVVVEKWDSVEALLAHTKAAHMADYRTRVKDYVVVVSLQILQPA
jgi:quinol monooxygenase YgiN